MALIAGAERHVVRGLRSDVPLAPGDIVEVELGDGGTPPVVRRAGGPAAGAWDPAGDALRWRQPGQAPSRMALLFQRQAILRAVREYFF